MPANAPYQLLIIFYKSNLETVLAYVRFYNIGKYWLDETVSLNFDELGSGDLGSLAICREFFKWGSFKSDVRDMHLWTHTVGLIRSIARSILLACRAIYNIQCSFEIYNIQCSFDLLLAKMIKKEFPSLRSLHPPDLLYKEATNPTSFLRASLTFCLFSLSIDRSSQKVPVLPLKRYARFRYSALFRIVDSRE